MQSPSLRDKSDTTRPRASPLGPGASPEAPDTQNPSKGFAPRPRGLFGGLGYPNPTKGFAPWRQGLFRGPCMHSAACAALGGFADAKTSGSLCRGGPTPRRGILAKMPERRPGAVPALRATPPKPASVANSSNHNPQAHDLAINGDSSKSGSKNISSDPHKAAASKSSIECCKNATYFPGFPNPRLPEGKRDDYVVSTTQPKQPRNARP